MSKDKNEIKGKEVLKDQTLLLRDSFGRMFSPGGTSLSAYIHTDYQKIVDVLGEPNSDGDGYKVDAEWVFQMNGKVITIYNHKDGNNYNNGNGLDVEDITEWHIGSAVRIDDELELLAKALDGRLQKF